MSVTHH